MTKQEAISYLVAMKGENKFVNPYREEALTMAISALREREERENPKPLTIEDLKQLVSRSIWWDWCEELCDVKKGYVNTSSGTYSFEFVVKNGNAYRSKPKEGY